MTSSNPHFPVVSIPGDKVKVGAWGLKLPTGFPKVESGLPVAFLGLSESIPDKLEHKTLPSSRSTGMGGCVGCTLGPCGAVEGI